MGAKSWKLQKIHHKHPACEGLVTTIPKIDGGALARIRSAQRRCQRGKCVCVIVPVSLYSESNCVFISMAILDLLHRGFAAKRYGLVEDTPANYKICANKIRSGFFRYLVGRVGLSAEEAKREAAASGLPDDWVEVTDEATGRIFYGNVKTGATQFERPQ